MPILNKYNMKGTIFIIGIKTYNNKKGIIKYSSLPKLRKLYPYIDFESHTFNLHVHLRKDIYNKTYKDAIKQNRYFNFSFLAYPYGDFSSEMIRAYKDIGIKMAFTYGKNKYATRRQNLYSIRRIKVNANAGFCGENLSLNAFVCNLRTFPYSQSYVISFSSWPFCFIASFPSNIFSGISSINLDILLHEVEPNIVLCFAHVKYKNSSALVNPT